MKIIDNFLKKEVFNKIKNVILSGNFPWYYNATVNTSDTKHSYFTHLIYFDDSYADNKNKPHVQSQHYVSLLPLLNQIEIKKLISILLT
jgi:hypothetical protein